MKDLKDYLYENSEDKYICESKAEDIISNFLKSDFVDKVKKLAKELSKKVLEEVFLLYYALFDSNIQQKDKILIVSSLIYLITPIDALSDFLPGGYTDDISLITYTFLTIKKYITKETREKAQNKIEELFC